jgi:hypothetical protein
MNTAENKPVPGFQSLEDLRALVLAHGELREAAALGLPLPPPSDDARSVQPPRQGAVTEAP